MRIMQAIQMLTEFTRIMRGEEYSLAAEIMRATLSTVKGLVSRFMIGGQLPTATGSRNLGDALVSNTSSHWE